MPSNTLVRGLEVLSALCDFPQTLFSREWFDRLSLPRPMKTLLWTTLSRAGYLTEVKAGVFRPSLRVPKLVSPVLSAIILRRCVLSIAKMHAPDLVSMQALHLFEAMPHSSQIRPPPSPSPLPFAT